jgi:MHS family citrate/tricarballylate:H+ symporter-like MFS transporter
MALIMSLANGLFGGFTPAIIIVLIQMTADRAAPALWMSFVAGISLTGALATLRSVGKVSLHEALA